MPVDWRPHVEFDRSECEGMVQLWMDDIEDDSAVLAECDRCHDHWGVPRSTLDASWLLDLAMRRSRLVPRLVAKPFEDTPGTQAARQAIEGWLASYEPGKKVKLARQGEPHKLFAEATVVAAPPDRPPLLVGPPGVGKTHLLTLAAEQLIRTHLVRVAYWTMADLLDEAKRLMDQGASDLAAFTEAASAPVLVLDDLGAERQTDWSEAARAQIIDIRYREGLPTLIATNLRPGQWPELFGDRTASRLLGMTRPVPIEGEDWRRR